MTLPVPATIRARSPRAPSFVGLALIASLAAGCATNPFSNDPYKKLAKNNEAARERLEFGLTVKQATAIMGEAAVRPPWVNPWNIGPQIVNNPLDTAEFESPDGERYVVHRYAVALSGEGRCPFVRGDAVLEPLIFFEEKLVGWRWTYLENVLQRRLRPAERGWSFGRFCDGAARPVDSPTVDSPTADPPESTTELAPEEEM